MAVTIPSYGAQGPLEFTDMDRLRAHKLVAEMATDDAETYAMVMFAMLRVLKAGTGQMDPDECIATLDTLEFNAAELLGQIDEGMGI